MRKKKVNNQKFGSFIYNYLDFNEMGRTHYERINTQFTIKELILI